MRLTSLLISVICILPMLLILAAWVLPLSAGDAENWHHITTYLLADYLRGSFGLITGVVILAAIMGVGSAWFTVRYDFFGRRVFEWLLVMPFAVPAYVMAMNYGSILEFAGPIQSGLRDLFDWSRGDYAFPQIRSLGGAMFVLALASYPYVYMLARGAFISHPAEWYEMSQSMGYSERSLFWRVGLPAARPFIVVGLALVVMEAAADIGAVELLGVPTLATGIYRVWYNFDQPILAARLATMLLIFAGTLLWLERHGRRRATYITSTNVSKSMRKPIMGLHRAGVMAFCAVPIVFGFLIPVFWTIRLAFFSSQSFDLFKLLPVVGDSVYLAIAGVICVVIAGFVLATAARMHRGRGRFIYFGATLGYAMPGVVIAISLLVMQGYVREWFGLNVLLTGTIAGLIYAYTIRFLSPAYGAISSGFEGISRELDMMSSVFGKSQWQLITQVYIPMLRAPVLAAALLVGIDILKELPATLILRPFDIRTLAVAVYEFAGDDRPADAAPYALVLIVLSMLAVIVLTKYQDK